jgi:hypothetical protein
VSWAGPGPHWWSLWRITVWRGYYVTRVLSVDVQSWVADWTFRRLRDKYPVDVYTVDMARTP